MIRSKGEAGTGDVSEATKHIRTITAEIAALTSKSQGRAVRRRQGTAGAVRARRRGRSDRQAPRRAVHRRWRRHARRRRADDAARRRRCLRRIRHLQVGQPGVARRRDRQGDHVLRRRRRRSPMSRAGWVRPWSASTSPTSPHRTASPSVAGNDPLRVGVLALQGDFREHLAVLSGLGADAVPVRRAGGARPHRRARHPRRRVQRHGQAVAHLRPRRAAASARSPAGCPSTGRARD